MSQREFALVTRKDHEMSSFLETTARIGGAGAVLAAGYAEFAPSPAGALAGVTVDGGCVGGRLIIDINNQSPAAVDGIFRQESNSTELGNFTAPAGEVSHFPFRSNFNDIRVGVYTDANQKLGSAICGSEVAPSTTVTTTTPTTRLVTTTTGAHNSTTSTTGKPTSTTKHLSTSSTARNSVTTVREGVNDDPAVVSTSTTVGQHNAVLADSGEALPRTGTDPKGKVQVGVGVIGLGFLTVAAGRMRRNSRSK